MIYYLLRICVSGCLAQPGEHHPYKVGVVGSSPSASTKIDSHWLRDGGVAKRLNAADCKSAPTGFGGSNLPPSTTKIGV